MRVNNGFIFQKPEIILSHVFEVLKTLSTSVAARNRFNLFFHEPFNYVKASKLVLRLEAFFVHLTHVTRDRNTDDADNADFHGFFLPNILQSL